MAEQPRQMSVSALAARCMHELDNRRHGESCDGLYCLELLRRATVQHNDSAKELLQQCLSEIARGWMRRHPKQEVACCLKSEEYYVAQACERFWQTVVQQEREFSTLVAVLRHLHVSLNGAVMDTLRAYPGSSENSMPGPGESSKPTVENYESSRALWESVYSLLPGPRERRVAYLLFHCGLQPGEIVLHCPQEFGNVQEIAHLRYAIIERLLRNHEQIG